MRVARTFSRSLLAGAGHLSRPSSFATLLVSRVLKPSGRAWGDEVVQAILFVRVQTDDAGEPTDARAAPLERCGVRASSVRARRWHRRRGVRSQGLSCRLLRRVTRAGRGSVVAVRLGAV